jgi:hypothetical protein
MWSSTFSALRTNELILGLPPMNQDDAAAEPMWRCFEKTASHPSFDVLPNLVDLILKNTEETSMSRLSETFDFSMEDRIPDDQFNVVIWAAIKGMDSPCPAPVRAAFVSVEKDDDED